MDRIDTAIEIDAPPAAVWAVVRDFDAYPDWNPFVRIVGRPNVGARLTVELAPPGRRTTRFRPTVTVHDPGRELRWRGSLGLRGLYDGEHRFLLEPLDGGTRTRLVHDETFSGLLVRPINWYVGGPARQGFLAANEALKARVETLVATGALDADGTRVSTRRRGDGDATGDARVVGGDGDPTGDARVVGGDGDAAGDATA